MSKRTDLDYLARTTYYDMSNEDKEITCVCDRCIYYTDDDFTNGVCAGCNDNTFLFVAKSCGNCGNKGILLYSCLTCKRYKFPSTIYFVQDNWKPEEEDDG